MRWLPLLLLNACAPAVGAVVLRVFNTVAPLGYAAYSAKTTYDEALRQLKVEEEKEKCSEGSGESSCAQRARP